MKTLLPSGRVPSGVRLLDRTEVPLSTVATGQPVIEINLTRGEAERLAEAVALVPCGAAKAFPSGGKERPSRGQRLWSVTCPIRVFRPLAIKARRQWPRSRGRLRIGPKCECMCLKNIWTKMSVFCNVASVESTVWHFVFVQTFDVAAWRGMSCALRLWRGLHAEGWISVSVDRSESAELESFRSSALTSRCCLRCSI